MAHYDPRAALAQGAASLHLVWLVLMLSLLYGCGSASAQVTPIRSSSGSATARGEYRPLALEEVAGVTLDNGHLIVRSARESVALDLPPQVDTAQVVRHWALVTEAHVGDRKALTFTHDETLHDFTIEVPDSDAEIRYGGFAARGGGDVLVLAWGDRGRCYWAYVVVSAPTSPAGR